MRLKFEKCVGRRVEGRWHLVALILRCLFLWVSSGKDGILTASPSRVHTLSPPVPYSPPPKQSSKTCSLLWTSPGQQSGETYGPLLSKKEFLNA